MSLSDFSDLTDLSSEEEDIPLARRTSKTRKTPKEYKINHVLRAPRTAQYTAKSLYDQIIDNSIDLDPEYQRDVVWQEEKQSGLIDSILRNYYIPPIIFAVTVQDDGSELRTCIDGKQRLTSIQRFIDGQIPHKDSYTNERLWFKSSATNARRKLLPQHLRTLFANKQIVCVEYTELDSDQEREIFQRVQLGVALTPAERLQALVGPWSTVIREIQNQVLGVEGFEGYLDWGHARGRDFQCLASIGYLIENHPKTAIPGPKTLEKWLQRTQPVSAQLRIDLHETFRIFVTLARDKKYSGSLNRPTRVSPIEFVMIGVLIYLKRQTLSLTQISSAAEKMRKDVRASHQDIRSNTRVTKHLMDFMAKKIKVSELKSDGEGDKPAALVIAKAAKPAKRKRPSYSDESDLEPIPSAKSAKRSTNPLPAEASKSSKQKSTAGQQKMNGSKKAPAASIAQANSSAKPSQLSTSRRTTNNSLSSFPPAPAQQSPLPISPIQTSHNQTSLLPPSISNGYDVPSNPVTTSTNHPPPTIQTGSTVKVESPHMSSLKSPAISSTFDRLAPIRAVKASLASASAPSPVSQSSEGRAIIGPSANTSQTPVGLQQNPAVQPIVHQMTDLPQRPPPPAQSLQATSQDLPPNFSRGQAVPAQLEGVLHKLRSQFPQLASHTQSSSFDAVSPTHGQNVHPSLHTGRSTTPSSIPGNVHPGGINHISQGHGVDIPRGPRNGNTSGGYPNPNQRPGPYVTPPAPGPSPGYGISGNVTSRPSTKFAASSSAGPHALPPRPATANHPSTFSRRDPLEPVSRSTSSDGANQDNRRGSYNRDRYHGSDDRRSSRYDRSQDYDRDKRNWSRR